MLTKKKYIYIYISSRNRSHDTLEFHGQVTNQNKEWHYMGSNATHVFLTENLEYFLLQKDRIPMHGTVPC